MKILLINQTQTKDITEIVTSISWSGDYQQVARKLEISVVTSNVDKYIPRVDIRLGNMIKLFDETGKELFRGYIFTKDKSSSGSEMKVTVFDGLNYLLKSKGTYNFKNLTAKQITRKVAQDFNIQVGFIVATGIPVSFIAEEQTAYDIIVQAYTEVSKQNGKKYTVSMVEGKLNIYENSNVVINYILSEDTNITESSYSETIENMVNRVRIYDENQKQIGIVENKDWINKYGVLQDIYKKEEDKNAYTVANNMLKGIENTISISAIGNVECVTGKIVQVKDTTTGIIGKFIIKTDEHTWQNRQHTMNLNLQFEEV